jgi:hypothetical protein
MRIVDPETGQATHRFVDQYVEQPRGEKDVTPPKVTPKALPAGDEDGGGTLPL